MANAAIHPVPEHDKLAFGAIALFSLSMYASIANVFPFLEVLRPALLTSTFALAALVMVHVAQKRPLTADGIRGLCFAGVIVLALLSTIWSVNPTATRAEAFELAKMFAIYLTMVNLITTQKRLSVICGAVVIGSLAPSIGALQQWDSGLNLVEGYRTRWLGIYADPNHLAMALVAMVPIAATFVVFARSWIFRVLSAVAIALAVTAIVLTYSRGGALGLGAALLIWAFSGSKKLKALLAVMAVLLGMLVFAPKSFWNRTGTVAQFQEDESALGRVYAWEVAAGINKDRPLLGVGVGAFRYAWQDYAPPEARHQAFVAHNVFLAVLAELGLVGFILFLVLVGRSLGGAASATQDPSVGPLARGIFAGLCGYMLCDMFSGYLVSAHFFFLIALAASCERVMLSAAQISAKTRFAPITAADQQFFIPAYETERSE